MLSSDRTSDAPPVGSGFDAAGLLSLVRRIAAGDGDAFVELYDTLSARLIRNLRSCSPDPVHVNAITVATFVEVWSLARFHTTPGTDVWLWITDIAARRSADRLPAADPGAPAAARSAEPGRPQWWAAQVDSQDRLAARDLAVLLGRRTTSRNGIPHESVRR